MNRKPLYAPRGAVATSQPLAASAGLAVLRRGGNAVDAAVATAVTLTVVQPGANGIGGDLFAIVRDSVALHGLNASGRSPAALAFEHPGKWQGRTFEIAGDELSMSELAAAFSRIVGREVQYTQVPWEAFEQQAGPDITRMFHVLEDWGYQVDISAVRQEYPDLMSFERWLHTKWVSARAA